MPDSKQALADARTTYIITLAMAAAFIGVVVTFILL